MKTGVKHVDTFLTNVGEVNNLTSIHKDITATGKPGAKKNVQILNKSGVVLLTACWEAYIEDLICEAFKFLLENCKAHENIPSSVRIKASKILKDSPNEKLVWDLAGDGWKKVMEDYGDTILKKQIDYFHVPRPDNIDELYENLIGIKKITSQWKWKGMSNSTCKKTLNEYIDLRGSIAHKIQSDRNVWKKDVDKYRRLLLTLCVITHNRVTDHLEKVTVEKGWRRGVRGNIK